MNDRTIEAACWRIWYRLKERGEATPENLMANCGIEKEVFEEAIQTLKSMGQIERTTSEIKSYELHDENARMMQVFSTIWRQELQNEQ